MGAFVGQDIPQQGNSISHKLLAAEGTRRRPHFPVCIVLLSIGIWKSGKNNGDEISATNTNRKYGKNQNTELLGLENTRKLYTSRLRRVSPNLVTRASFTVAWNVVEHTQ